MSELVKRFGCPTHFWCEECGATRPAEMRDLKGLDTTGRFLGGDIVCTACRTIIATYGYPAAAQDGAGQRRREAQLRFA